MIKFIFKIFLIFTFTITLFSCGQEKFDMLNIEYSIIDADVSANLHSVYFITRDTGFIVGDNGIVLKTDDNGFTWTKKNLNDKSLRDIHFCDKNVGFIVGYQSIYRTLDGGETWEQIDTQYELLSTVFCINKDTCFIPADYDVVRTINGGINWHEQYLGSWFGLYDICKVGENVLIAVGINGCVSSNNYFETWTTIAHKASSISYVSDDFILSTNNLTISVSYDKGINWQNFKEFNGGKRDGVDQVVGVSKSDIFVLYGYTSKILRTEDAGNSWRSLDLGDIIDMVNVNDEFIFAVGKDGVIFKLEI